MAIAGPHVVQRWLTSNENPSGHPDDRVGGDRKSAIHFKGTTLYSYRDTYPIATVRRDYPSFSVTGQRYEHTAYIHPYACMWSRAFKRDDPEAPHSSTTARHIGHALQGLHYAGYYIMPVLTLPGNIGAAHAWLGAQRVDDERTLTVCRIQRWCEKLGRARERAYADTYLNNALHALHHLRLVQWQFGPAPEPSTPLSLAEPSPDAILEQMREELWMAKLRRELVA